MQHSNSLNLEQQQQQQPQRRRRSHELHFSDYNFFPDRFDSNKKGRGGGGGGGFLPPPPPGMSLSKSYGEGGMLAPPRNDPNFRTRYIGTGGVVVVVLYWKWL